jgi:hypothetical protein
VLTRLSGFIRECVYRIEKLFPIRDRLSVSISQRCNIVTRIRGVQKTIEFPHAHNRDIHPCAATHCNFRRRISTGTLNVQVGKVSRQQLR